jgi:hypothetical protein
MGAHPRGIAGWIALAISLMAVACGTDDVPEPGAPAPPEADAETDCPELEGDPVEPFSRPAGGELAYGFNDHAGLVGSIGVGEDAELQAQAGSTLWRVAIDWRFAEPERDEIELETHDAIYCEAIARGIRPIFHITGSPEWAADPGGCPLVSCLYPPRVEELAELRGLATRIADRYPQAAAIEVWNEPNLATYWARPDPARYVEVLEAIDSGVAAAGTAIPVLAGSLSNTSRDNAGRADFAPFLRRMMASGAGEHMDGLAFHPYPIGPLGSRRERFESTMNRMRRALRASGEEDVPIWITEVGLPVGTDADEQDVARTMTGIYEQLATDPRVQAVIFHTLLEGESAAGAGEGFGWLVRGEDGGVDARPVYERFAERADR